MVRSRFTSGVRTNNNFKYFRKIRRQFFCKMDDLVIFFFGIQNINNIAITCFKNSCISYLSSAFWIKWRHIKNELINFSVLNTFYLSISRNFNFSFGIIVANEFLLFIISQNLPVACFYFGSSTGTFFLFLQF